MQIITLLVVVVVQLLPQAVLPTPGKSSSELQVAFEDLPGVTRGTPVVYRGAPIGTVSAVEERRSEVSAETAVRPAPRYLVSIRLKRPLSGQEREGVVALLSFPILSAKRAPEAIIELLPYPGAEKGALPAERMVAGYSSFEDYWRVDRKS